MKHLSSVQWEEARVAFRIMLAAGIAASLFIFTTQGISSLLLGLLVGTSVITFLAMLYFHRWRS
ncbi:hypothetical protein LZC95_05285 [Pendulispora brunnea]|uniref:Uncharacterized protein n=1 Tax=Pendulispora brunnea TaxID=2905690 RepID=A0ABZ2KG08_9BACT